MAPHDCAPQVNAGTTSSTRQLQSCLWSEEESRALAPSASSNLCERRGQHHFAEKSSSRSAGRLAFNRNALSASRCFRAAAPSSTAPSCVVSGHQASELLSIMAEISSSRRFLPTSCSRLNSVAPRTLQASPQARPSASAFICLALFFLSDVSGLRVASHLRRGNRSSLECRKQREVISPIRLHLEQSCLYPSKFRLHACQPDLAGRKQCCA